MRHLLTSVIALFLILWVPTLDFDEFCQPFYEVFQVLFDLDYVFVYHLYYLLFYFVTFLAHFQVATLDLFSVLFFLYYGYNPSFSTFEGTTRREAFFALIKILIIYLFFVLPGTGICILAILDPERVLFTFDFLLHNSDTYVTVFGISQVLFLPWLYYVLKRGS
jgi:hypothetical protein